MKICSRWAKHVEKWLELVPSASKSVSPNGNSRIEAPNAVPLLSRSYWRVFEIVEPIIFIFFFNQVKSMSFYSKDNVLILLVIYVSRDSEQYWMSQKQGLFMMKKREQIKIEMSLRSSIFGSNLSIVPLSSDILWYLVVKCSIQWVPSEVQKEPYISSSNIVIVSKERRRFRKIILLNIHTSLNKCIQLMKPIRNMSWFKINSKAFTMKRGKYCKINESNAFSVL